MEVLPMKGGGSLAKVVLNVHNSFGQMEDHFLWSQGYEISRDAYQERGI